MGGRTAPNWIAFDGGPRDGQREIVYAWGHGSRLFYTPATPGLRTPHEYALTVEARRIGSPVPVRHRVARYVRTLPDEAEPAAVSVAVHQMRVW